MIWHIMSADSQTIKTYDDSAEQIAEYFKGIGARTEDIKRGLELANVVDGGAKVIEIGCGDGRDAAEIVKLTDRYEGFDPSRGLLKLARKKLPGVSFVEADALSYRYPRGVDVVYAFASLLHVNRQDISVVFRKAAKSLKPGGIFYISLKERSDYVEEMKSDVYGERMFYYYSPSVINNIAGDEYESVYEDHQKIGSTDWFTIALRRV